jgi:predicted nucleic acid-binding protein
VKARGLAVRAAECLIATFCIHEGFALLHASPSYEPFEKLGLTTAKV